MCFLGVRPVVELARRVPGSSLGRASRGAALTGGKGRGGRTATELQLESLPTKHSWLVTGKPYENAGLVGFHGVYNLSGWC